MLIDLSAHNTEPCGKTFAIEVLVDVGVAMANDWITTKWDKQTFLVSHRTLLNCINKVKYGD